MEKEKQIEGMIKTMTGFCLPTSDDEIRAKKLFAAGYGNVKEALKETAREILKMLHDIGGCDATDDYSRGWDNAINEAYKTISDKYGVTAFDEEVRNEKQIKHWGYTIKNSAKNARRNKNEQ